MAGQSEKEREASYAAPPSAEELRGEGDEVRDDLWMAPELMLDLARVFWEGRAFF